MSLRVVVPIVLTVVARVSAQPQFEAVPAEWLDGSGLVATELNVSLLAPGPDWEWLLSSAPAEEGPNGFRAIACRSADGSKMFLVSVHNPHWGPLDDDSAAELVLGVRQGLESNGFTIVESTHERTSVPLPGSDRFTVQAALPDGSDMHLFGYSATQERLFQFQYASIDSAEPVEFRRFVESFEVVGNVPGRFPEELTQQGGMVAFGILTLLTLVVGLGGWIVNAIGGRVVVNVWTYWLLFLALYVVALSVGWWIVAPEDLEPFTFGYVHGSVVLGPVILPALFALWRWRRLGKKRASEAHAAA